MWWILLLLPLFLIGLNFVEQKIRKKIKTQKDPIEECHVEAEKVFNKFMSVINDVYHEQPPEYMLNLKEEAKSTREKYIRLRTRYWHDEKETLQLAQDWFLYMNLFFYKVYAPQLIDEGSKTLKLENPKWTEKQDYQDSKITLEEIVRRFDSKLASLQS